MKIEVGDRAYVPGPAYMVTSDVIKPNTFYRVDRVVKDNNTDFYIKGARILCFAEGWCSVAKGNNLWKFIPKKHFLD